MRYPWGLLILASLGLGGCVVQPVGGYVYEEAVPVYQAPPPIYYQAPPPAVYYAPAPIYRGPPPPRYWQGPRPYQPPPPYYRPPYR